MIIIEEMRKSLEIEFAKACREVNLKEILRLFPHFDLNTTTFKFYLSNPSPLLASLHWSGNTQAMELLMTLGAIPTPKDAYHIKIKNELDIHMPEEYYYNFFKKRGYDIDELANQYESESESEKTPKDNRSLLQRYFDKRK